jgi:eukaryotic-like serine/threonine-protein kinase
MTTKRWQRVEELYHAALSCTEGERATLLARECGSDEELRREVESLLRQSISRDDFLTAAGAMAAAAPTMAQGTVSTLIGRRIGAYQLEALVGTGGMGDVYRARDTKLGRDVAIKVLPRLFTADLDRLARFEREAHLLASLNHPHIAAIYGFEDADGVPALVLELVDGETLAERVQRGALRVSEALMIARQIADALESSHERGIVHRDLKPANVKITSDRVVKVLDFGLAKAAAGDRTGRDLTQSAAVTVGTRDGVILGTAAYMSPEQARGEVVDKRTDIWAFGCVLYEMLTGQRAFGGRTLTDTLAAVLEREPDWRILPDTTPSTIRRLLQRCLEKDSKRRLRDIGDARIDIDEAISSPTRTESAIAVDRTQALRRWRMTAVLSLVTLVIGAALVTWFVRSPNANAGAFGTTRMTAARLTSYNGRQYAGALAPDGRSFVFVSNHAGSPDIWLRQVSGGEPIRLTNNALEEDDLAFAPDGESVYFTQVDEVGEAIWQIRTLGGQARKVIANGHGAAASPDGRTLAYMTPEKQDLSESLVVSTLDGSATRTLVQQIPSFPRVRPAWSPDGRSISYVRAGLFAPSNLFVVDTNTGRERQLTRFTRPAQGVGQHAWLPDNHHLVVSFVLDPSRIPVANDLAILNIDDGAIARFTTTIADNFVAPSLSADGSRLLTSATGLLREVWRVPLKGDDADANASAAARLIDGAQDPLWTFVTRDGRTLLYNSPASGNRNLWTMPLNDSSKARQITAVPGDAITHSALSPDGARVAFVSFASGAADIWTQNIDGTDLRQLTKDPAADSWPAWSPDGRSIAFTSMRDGAQQTWVVPSEGGPGQKLIDGFFRGDWVEQPGGNGTWIVTSNNRDTIRLIDVERREVMWEERIAGSAASLPMFSPDRRSISVVVQSDGIQSPNLQVGTPVASIGVPAATFAPRRSPSSLLGVGSNAVAILDVATRRSRIVARLPFSIVFRASWVDNGTALVVNRNDPTSHIVMFDRFWEPENR